MATGPNPRDGPVLQDGAAFTANVFPQVLHSRFLMSVVTFDVNIEVELIFKYFLTIGTFNFIPRNSSRF